MAGDRRGRKLSEFETTLFLAVAMVDPVTRGEPRGRPRVSIPGAEGERVRNRSGYHLFLDASVSDPTLVVDGGDYYLDERVQVPRSTFVDQRGDPKRTPSIAVWLTPAPAYEFPAGATVVRGRVTESPARDDPVPGAELSLERTDVATRAVAAGEYVLYVPPDVGTVTTDADGDRVVQVGGDDPSVAVDHPDGSTSTTVTPTLVEGRQTTVDVAFH